MDPETMNEAPQEVLITEVGVRKWLMRVMALVLAAFLITSMSKLYLHHDFVFGLVPRFDAFFAATVPSWFAAVCLLFGAGIAAVAATAAEPGPLHRGWVTFAVLLVVLSVERTTGTLRGLIAGLAFGSTLSDPGSLLTNIPFVLLFTIVGIVLFTLSPERRSFWSNLPPVAQKGISVSFGLYVVSTLVLPPLIFWRVELLGWENAGAYALVGAQWLTEIVAYILMLCALVAYAGRDLDQVRIRFARGK